MSPDTAALRALAEGATPWTVRADAVPRIGDFGWLVEGCPAGETEDSEQGRADAVYIAALDPATVIALCDKADRLDRLTAALRELHQPTVSGRWTYCPACALAYPCETAEVLDRHDPEETNRDD